MKLRDLLFVVALLAVLIIVFTIQGCHSAIEKHRDKDFTNGCVVIESQLKLGIFNQEGVAEVCKLKCSEKLPKNFKYKYENPRSGCSVEISNASR